MSSTTVTKICLDSKSTCPDLEHRDKIIVFSFLVVENNNIIYFRRSTSSSESKIDINL